MVEINNQLKVDEDAESTEDLGLFENYGTFPVWMLKAIQLMTPGFLLTKNSSQDNDDKSEF